MNEQQLQEALRNPEMKERAFAELVTQNSEKLYWVVRHIVGSHEDADDVVQNAFVKAWQKLGDFHGDSKFSTWLHRIAVNEALDFIRREKKHSNNTGSIEDLKGSFADSYFDGDEVERQLREAMEMLPEAQRTVFSLKYFENMQYKEISNILGTTEGGLKANYHHAVAKIKKYMGIPDGKD